MTDFPSPSWVTWLVGTTATVPGSLFHWLVGAGGMCGEETYNTPPGSVGDRLCTALVEPVAPWALLAATPAAVPPRARGVVSVGVPRPLRFHGRVLTRVLHHVATVMMYEAMQPTARSLRSVLAISVALACAACGSSSTSRTFVSGVDNPWFPLEPGTTWIYKGVKDGESGRDVMTVTRRTKVVKGVRCVVVRDLLYLKGKLAERTDDWYAQDADGNVWYFGEETAELDENGKVTSREGSWEAGVDGAREGIYMPAKPRVGQTFEQEHYEGHAEDHFEVLSVTSSVVVPYTAAARALLTKEWTPLEPDVVGQKVYIRGVGLAKEETVKGGDERFELTDVLHK